MLILHTKVEKHYRHFKNIKGNLDEEIYYVFYLSLIQKSIMSFYKKIK